MNLKKGDEFICGFEKDELIYRGPYDFKRHEFI